MNETPSKEVTFELRQFFIKGLFGYLNHRIPFPGPSVGGIDPNVVILHGRNGIGKTTILQMLDGILRLDFNIFRVIPFKSAELQFTNDLIIRVSAIFKDNELSSLNVTYKEFTVALNPKQPGPVSRTAKAAVEIDEFRKIFISDTKLLQFDYIDIERLKSSTPSETQPHTAFYLSDDSPPKHEFTVSRTGNPKARKRTQYPDLSARVAEFIRDAQVNVRRFFSSSEPELFQKVIERMTSSEESVDSLQKLRRRLEVVHIETLETEQYGLEAEYWDFDQIIALVDDLKARRGAARKHAITVLNSYIEMLESRVTQHKLVADRLRTFESEIAEFFEGKRVKIHRSEGLTITTDAGKTLRENQLSSGEFHLLYLLVSALVTRRRGTVIAIDEPEMSMHIAWQRKLIPALLRCASKAEPLFILATHSPDLAASFSDGMIDLG